MKLHVGCGSIYLREYVNIDLPLPSVFLARQRPDLVERFTASEDNYYGQHADKTADALRRGPVTAETVCDVYGSFELLPVRPATVGEILSRQVFEHLDRKDASHAIAECNRALKTGGTLRLDVPDPDATLKEYLRTGDEFFIRHLFGPRRDLWGMHTHWTRHTLRALVEPFGFRLVQEEPNVHFYPAFCLRWEKRDV